MLMPKASNKAVGIIIGIVFLCTGLNSIYKFITRDGAKLYSLSLAYGIIYLLLGILLIVYPYSVMKFVVICLGIYLTVFGTMKVNFAFWLKKGSEESWLITFVSGLLLIFFGILVMFNPFVELTLTMLGGIFLIICGILDITDTILFKKRAKEIRNIFW